MDIVTKSGGIFTTNKDVKLGYGFVVKRGTRLRILGKMGDAILVKMLDRLTEEKFSLDQKTIEDSTD